MTDFFTDNFKFQSLFQAHLSIALTAWGIICPDIAEKLKHKQYDMLMADRLKLFDNVRAILKCLAMLAGRYLPPTEFLTTDFIKKITSVLKSDIQTQFQNLLNSDNFNEQIINNPQQTISLLWDIYYQIQLLLKDKYNLSDKILKDPLSTQFKIEYWKYENLFL